MSLSIEEIQHLARTPTLEDKFADYADWNPVPALQELWKDQRSDHRSWRSAMQEAQAGPLRFLARGVVKGERNEMAFNHAKRLKALGKSQSEAESLLMKWNRLNRPPTPETEMGRTIKSVYSYKGSRIDPGNILQFLRNDPVYQKMDALARDVYITLLIRANTESKASIDEYGTRYQYEPGDQKFTFRTFPGYCARDVEDSAVRRTIQILEEHGRIERIQLGGQRGSILRFKRTNTETDTGINTNDEIA